MNLPHFFELLIAWACSEDDRCLPAMPGGLPDAVQPIVVDAGRRLTEYHNAEHARPYMRRLYRFADRRGVEVAVVYSARQLQWDGAFHARRLDNWLQIINSLLKPVRDGELTVPNLPTRITDLCALAVRDGTGRQVQEAIAVLRAGVAHAA